MAFEEKGPHWAKRGWLGVTIALCLVTGISLAYVKQEHSAARQSSAARDAATAQLTQAQNQIKNLSDRLDALAARTVAQDRPSPLGAPQGAVQAASKKTARTPAEDKRIAQLQAQLAEQGSQLSAQGNELADQKKQLDDARDETQKTRDDLQSSLNSTRDDLNQSIATTHDEVLALKKRGELNVYEFNLPKAKTFQKVGPIQVVLTKTNQKHKYYDVALMVDDARLEKKHVNLFEPIWINLADRPRPLELVVNQVGKDRITGYLTEPKYRNQELATNAAPADQPRKLEPRADR